MRLYHGSNTEINIIDFAWSRPYKDFGRAFYLSANKEQAKEMAKFKSIVEGGAPFVTEFDFDESNLEGKSGLKVLSFLEYSKEWAEFVFHNRQRSEPAFIHEYDIVYGPVANDRVGAQIVKYQEGDITFEVFLERLKYMKGITFQYAFCTGKAVKLLGKV